ERSRPPTAVCENIISVFPPAAPGPFPVERPNSTLLGNPADPYVEYTGPSPHCSITAQTLQPSRPSIGRWGHRTTSRQPCERGIDRTGRRRVKARLRVLGKHILRHHGYEPDWQARATRTILEQAELLSERWVAA
ncbi:MAG: DUF3387 domain-containing protein, partial [Acidobacteria bacterium]|nr:DUF3387 domain-containing protein [Acidobacteriota bacterium]